MHKLQPSTNQLVSVAKVYPKPLATEFGSLMGFVWVDFLASDSSDPLNPLYIRKKCKGVSNNLLRLRGNDICKI